MATKIAAVQMKLERKQSVQHKARFEENAYKAACDYVACVMGGLIPCSISVSVAETVITVTTTYTEQADGESMSVETARSALTDIFERIRKERALQLELDFPTATQEDGMSKAAQKLSDDLGPDANVTVTLTHANTRRTSV